MDVLIYKATNNTSQKSYIGFTESSLDERKKIHYSDARRGTGYHFHNALLKYDIDDWTWEILATCESREMAAEIEIQMIQEHNTFHTGYNGTTGGDFGFTMSAESRQKISKSLTGRTFSDEHKHNLSKALTGYKRGPHNEETREKIRQGNLGKTQSQETKDKISAARKGRPNGHKGFRHTEETKQKMSIAAKLRWARDKSQ